MKLAAHRDQLLKFVASGAFNTFATYILYLALLTRFRYQVSFSIAYASGIGLAYAMNRYLVFRKPGGRAGPLLVTLIYAGQYILNLALVSVWVRRLSGPAALAPLFAVALTLPLTYLLNQRVFSVRASDRRPVTAPALAWRKLQPWWPRVAMIVLVGLPIVSLTLNAIAWLRFGVDLPFFDDWRAYNSGDIDSFDLPYLFRQENDTLSPIGSALDAMAQRFLDGNSVAYQLLSMVAVLGMLLLLQWKLLRSALGDPLQTALCFVFTLLMLQPGSYWGRENLAYQQALPLVFILSALWLAMTPPWRDRWNIPAVFVLGLLSGLSYISGALGALAAGAGVVFMALLQRAHVRRVRALLAGASLALAGAATSFLQVFYAVAPFKGMTTAGKALAVPTEANFWFYYLGKVGRSLLLPEGRPVLSLIVVLMVLGSVIAVAILTVRGARSAEPDADRYLRFAMIFGAIGAMVFTYLLLVSAGRANNRPAEVQSATDVFKYAFQRFHFFWAALLWPWLVAGVILTRDRWVAPAWMSGPFRAARVIVPVMAIASMISLGALAHFQWHRAEAATRYPTLDCLMTQLQKGEAIDCDEWRVMGIPDLSRAFIYARQIGASFVRYFPVLPLELGVDSPSPWLRLSRDQDRVEGVRMVRRSGRFYRAGDQPQLHIDVGHSEGMASCVMLDVRGLIKTAKPDTVKLYFRPLGQQEFTETSWVTQAIGAGPQGSTFNFRLENGLGFESTLRLNPVVSQQDFELSELEVRCRLGSRDNTVVPVFTIFGNTIAASLHNLESIGDGEGRFRAGKDASVVFSTRRQHTMASCRVLEVQAIYQVEAEDIAQLYFRPLGVNGFSDRNSLSKPVSPQPAPEKLTLTVNSASGFEDQLRFDPVKHPQTLRFADIQLRCLKRVGQPSSSR